MTVLEAVILGILWTVTMGGKAFSAETVKAPRGDYVLLAVEANVADSKAELLLLGVVSFKAQDWLAFVLFFHASSF